MKAEQNTRDFTLRLIQILVWFVILWAIVFFVGLAFQWSGLTDQLAETFFGSAFCVVLVLAALAVLNITANLNIISKTQVRAAAGAEMVESKPSSFVKTLLVAAFLIGIFVLALGYIELRLYRTKVSETMSRIESIRETKLIDEAVNLINTNGKVEELVKIREALSASIQSGARLSLIFPLMVNNVPIYYELTAWWYGSEEDKISEAKLPKFVPLIKEQKNWKKLVAGEVDSFSIYMGNSIRVFHSVKTDKGEVILLIDTSRRFDSLIRRF